MPFDNRMVSFIAPVFQDRVCETMKQIHSAEGLTCLVGVSGHLAGDIQRSSLVHLVEKGNREPSVFESSCLAPFVREEPARR